MARKQEDQRTEEAAKKDGDQKEQEKEPVRKLGAGHAGAMFRLGFKELRNAVSPSRESVADSEIGLYGSLTQGEIAQARGSYGLDSEQEKSLDNAAQGKEVNDKQGQETHQTSVLGYPLNAQAAQMGGQEQSQSRGR